VPRGRCDAQKMGLDESVLDENYGREGTRVRACRAPTCVSMRVPSPPCASHRGPANFGLSNLCSYKTDRVFHQRVLSVGLIQFKQGDSNPTK